MSSTWGREFIWPDDDWGHEGGWLSRLAVPDAEEALEIAAMELGESVERIQLRPILMREESEVEAKIGGHEFPCWVECTTRARKPEPFWRVELVEAGES